MLQVAVAGFVSDVVIMSYCYNVVLLAVETYSNCGIIVSYEINASIVALEVS